MQEATHATPLATCSSVLENEQEGPIRLGVRHEGRADASDRRRHAVRVFPRGFKLGARLAVPSGRRSRSVSAARSAMTSRCNASTHSATLPWFPDTVSTPHHSHVTHAGVQPSCSAVTRHVAQLPVGILQKGRPQSAHRQTFGWPGAWNSSVYAASSGQPRRLTSPSKPSFRSGATLRSCSSTYVRH